MSLEVAEHLSGKAGARLVHTLTQAAPLVMFSAAVPQQRGSHHINEQWPGYWRSLFTDEGFRLFDPIRPLIRATVPYNSSIGRICFFFSQQGVSAHPRLGPEVVAGEEMGWVHISLVTTPRDLRATLRNVPGLLGHGAK
jgi:hypothetical protein